MSFPPESRIGFASTKTYTHSVGLSCCFRQWRAESHCRFLHGYALQVHCAFAADELDVRNWVVDFGSLKSFKGWLEDTFDHKLLVAQDDPMGQHLLDLAKVHGVADVVILPRVGMEAFAEMIYRYLETWLYDNGYSPRVRLFSVKVSEHEANSAICYNRDIV